MLDFGDVVIHVMSEDQRNYYDLESFYGAAEEVSMLSSCLFQQHLIYCILENCKAKAAFRAKLPTWLQWTCLAACGYTLSDLTFLPTKQRPSLTFIGPHKAS